MGKRQFPQKIWKPPNETFQMIKQVYGEEAWDVVLCLSGTNVTNVLHRGGTVWKIMSILVGQE
jgi:hypothetical protein